MAQPAITREMIEAAATAIANNRAARGHGSPAISNVLAILPQKLKAQVLEDAEDALKAAAAVAGGLLASVAIPAAGTEERDFWLEAAEQHGAVPIGLRDAYEIPEPNLLRLMAAAHEQGRKDVLTTLTTGGAE